MKFELITKTFIGLRPVLAQELAQLGANNVQVGRGMVSFTGNQEVMYRANFQLHTAIHILKPIKHFKARSAKEVYGETRTIDWSQYIEKGKIFSVGSVVYSEEFRNPKFVIYGVKDIIVDQFREKTGARPNISVSNPDARLHTHIAEEDATLCSDSSGEPLHRKSYRQESVEAPLNEVLTAGMILMTDWKGKIDFIDPMCVNDTLLVEAAPIARNMSPGIFRKEFAFEKWPDFSQELFDRIYNDESRKSEFTYHIYGYDINTEVVSTTRLNVKTTGLTEGITMGQTDFKNSKKPQEPSIFITNLPYSKCVSMPNLLGAYKMVGERLKHKLMGNDAWILSYREECFEQIGLKSSIKIPVCNGSLEYEFRKYAIFDGKVKKFRAEGGVTKTEAEKKEMAEKHRFKKNREFKKCLEENEESKIADIRSFKFHSLERVQERDERKKGRNRRNDRSYDSNDRPDYRGKKRFDKDGRGRSLCKRGGKEHGRRNY